MEGADAAEKTVGVEGKAEEPVDLLNKDHDWRLDLLQQDLIDEGDKVVDGRVGLCSTVLPPAAEVDPILQPQLFEQGPNRA